MTIHTIPIDDDICVHYDRFQGVACISATDNSVSTLWETGRDAQRLVRDAETFTSEHFCECYAEQLELME